MRIPAKTFSKLSTLLLVVLFLLIASGLTFAAERDSRGVAATGIGVHLLSQPTDPDCRIANPAGTSWITSYAITAGYINQWGISELDMYLFQAVLPHGDWTGGLRVSGFGNDLYSEQAIALSLSKQIRHNLAFGIESSYEQQQIEGYRDDNRIFISPGLLYLHHCC